MARKVRVHELAKELGVTSKHVLLVLSEAGEFVKSASSTVERPAAERVRSHIRGQERGLPSITPRYGRADSAAARNASPAAMPRNVSAIKRSPSPSTSMYGWSANPVRKPTSPEIAPKIRELSHQFPAAHDLIDTLDQLGSQIVYASLEVEKNQYRGIATVRFSGAIEAAFGFTREIIILFTPYSDLQARVLGNLRHAMRATRREVTPDIAFIWGRDLRIKSKLQDWSLPELQLIPLRDGEELDPIGFINHLRDYVFARDLFNRTTPVKGGQFFGRQTLLQALHDDVRNQRVSGIFGLRKAGKTSVLKQLQADFEGSDNHAILLDLEAFPSPPEADPIPDILVALERKLEGVLGSCGITPTEMSTLDFSRSIFAFKTSLEDSLTLLARTNQRLTIMLDEIEFLTPSDRIDVAEGPWPQISQFLAALRSVVQERTNFTFLLSGLTSAIIEGGRLYGRPNPLFSWAKPYYVGPLTRPEADQLAMTVGGKMGVEIETRALKAIYDASGGHAFLYRNLASAVVERLPTDTLRRKITSADVLFTIDSWRGTVRGSIEEMVAHVRRYYDVEAILLDALEESDELFESFSQAEPQALAHLVSLGLVHREDRKFVRNTLLELI